MIEKLRPALYIAAALLVASAYVSWCHDPAVRADERRRGGDRHDDSTVTRLIYENAHQQQVFKRERDSTGRVIRGLLGRLGRKADEGGGGAKAAERTEPAVDVSRPAPATDVRDSLIAAYAAGRAEDSLQLLFYRSQIAQRDSLIPRLTAARDALRQSAQRPSYTVTDIGGGAITGYGLATRCSACVLGGAATILLPRAVHLLGRIF